MLAVGLLGLGTIGRAVADRLPRASGRDGRRARVVAALARAARPAPSPGTPPTTSDPDDVFAARPDVIVELLGGVEPAHTLVARALDHGIPVVTANKSLLAARGAELAARAAARGVPLLYEAAVLAGVPFLGTLARRPEASDVSRITGILNGTSNYILTRIAQGESPAAALADAQRLGLAEPQPDHDLRGIDAAEKLAVLVQHVGWGRLDPAAIETAGIEELDAADVAAARRFGGAIRPLARAERGSAGLSAFSAPAFLPDVHPFARVEGVENAVALTTPAGDVTFRGPGAGPAATAATVIDDVFEAAGTAAPIAPPADELEPVPALTGWFARLDAPALPAWDEIADLCASYGIWTRRCDRAGRRGYLLTHPAAGDRLRAALEALRAAAGVESVAIRALES